MRTELNNGARTPKGERAQLVLDSAAWCYFGAALVVVLNLMAHRGLTLLNAGVSLAVPSAGILLFVLSCVLVPSLVAPRRMEFPLPLTLPAVYCALTIMAFILSTRIGSALVALPQPMQVVTGLARWEVLMEIYFAGLALLSYATWKERRREGSATVDSA